MVRDRRKRNEEAYLTGGPLATLTERETDVLALLAAGMSNKEIARALCITTHTVKAHVTRILHKLNVEGRTEAAVLWVLSEGSGVGGQGSVLIGERT